MEMMDHIKESARTCGGLFELTERRNVVSAAVAGFLFMTGWWCIIDVAVKHPLEAQFHHAYHVIGVFSTIAFIMINMVSNGQVRGEGYSDGCIGQRGARVWLFLGFLLGFSAVIASAWILFQNYVSHTNTPDQHYVFSSWPGVGMFLQNIFIFLGALVFKFGRSEGDG